MLMFVVIVSLRAKEVTRLGLMSMLSSIIMIGKSSAENFWLKEPSRRHLYSTTAPLFCKDITSFHPDGHLPYRVLQPDLCVGLHSVNLVHPSHCCRHSFTPSSLS